MQHGDFPGRLFGTDGIRGVAGRAPLDSRTVRHVGAAIAQTLPRAESALRLLVGRDTRESGVWIERELTVGAQSAGAMVTRAGVLPTPAVAYLTRSHGFDAGVVISASHNPYEDNGIKVFAAGGVKLDDSLELAVERYVRDPAREPHVDPTAGLPDAVDLSGGYLDYVTGVLPDARRLLPMRLALDCANGAMSVPAPRLFRDRGFDVECIGVSPDGRNINRGCGSTHPEGLAELVVRRGCTLGAAFDGDGDRAIFVDGSGRVVNGDAVLLLCAKHLRSQGRLRCQTVVATVMSNIGLELALRKAGIGLVRCPVGDKFVMEEMTRRSLSLGGEQSGHIIFADWLTTGDGLITALSVLRAMADSGRALSDLAGDLTPYPQVLVNVPVRDRVALAAVPAVATAMADVERRLDGRGRLLVRYSGTEPLLRIMLEGPDETELRELAARIADAVGQHAD